MYHIAVLAEKEMEGQYYAEQIARFCSEKGFRRGRAKCGKTPSLHLSHMWDHMV